VVLGRVWAGRWNNLAVPVGNEGMRLCKVGFSMQSNHHMAVEAC
jgi:hypothetical protein